MEIFIRINKDGNFHRGDLNKLNRDKGKILGVELPDIPKKGAKAIVRVEMIGGKNEDSGEVEEIVPRPSTFHP